MVDGQARIFVTIRNLTDYFQLSKEMLKTDEADTRMLKVNKEMDNAIIKQLQTTQKLSEILNEKENWSQTSPSLPEEQSNFGQKLINENFNNNASLGLIDNIFDTKNTLTNSKTKIVYQMKKLNEVIQVQKDSPRSYLIKNKKAQVQIRRIEQAN